MKNSVGFGLFQGTIPLPLNGAHQVTMTEKYAKSIQSDAHDLDEREGIKEDFLHLMVELQSLFDHMELISNGISTIFHHRRLSPLLVDRKAVVMRVREVQVEQREKGLELMISPTNIWQTPISYVITRDLNIHIMLHVPIGRSNSFRKVFRYIPTPLTFGDDTKHFMVDSRNPYLLLNKNGQHPDCRLVHDDFVLEPTIDFGDQDNELSEISLTFDNDLNMSQVLEWGSETGLLRPSDQGNALTMLEVAGRWNHDQLDETRRWTFQMIMGVAGASILALVVCCCCTRECWNIYMRAKQRRAMTSSIREQVRENGVEMRNLLSQTALPSAPMQPASEIS